LNNYTEISLGEDIDINSLHCYFAVWRPGALGSSARRVVGRQPKGGVKSLQPLSNGQEVWKCKSVNLETATLKSRLSGWVA
jgi:hypothetical protein